MRPAPPILDNLRAGFFRVADDVSLALQNAGKTFGFLADGRDLVDMEIADDAYRAAFHDHEDAGWPAVSVRLPHDARFQYAASAPLSRIAFWVVPRPAFEALEELDALPDAPDFQRVRTVVWDARIDDDTLLRIAEPEPGKTAILLRQRRSTNDVADSIRERAERWKSTNRAARWYAEHRAATTRARQDDQADSEPGDG